MVKDLQRQMTIHRTAYRARTGHRAGNKPQQPKAAAQNLVKLGLWAQRLRVLLRPELGLLAAVVVFSGL